MTAHHLPAGLIVGSGSLPRASSPILSACRSIAVITSSSVIAGVRHLNGQALRPLECPFVYLCQGKG
jgi:hypothetical protein